MPRPAVRLLPLGAAVCVLAAQGVVETPVLEQGAIHQRLFAAQSSAPDAELVPYEIHVDDAVLTDLRDRLSEARLPDEVGQSWDYGTDLAYLKELVAYWRDEFDWRAQERRLNQFDQFMTNIDGLDIHFIHQRSPDPDARPLLLLNGWPSSIDEFSKVIGPLTDPAAHGGSGEDAFHVVVPAMPGYGFSDKPNERGFSPERMATLWMTLMARLGYTSYGTHGTDWGISVGTWLALKDPTHMAGLHLTGCIGALPRSAAQNQAPRPTSDTTGYSEIQSTKPQTLGYSLSDSPVGLAAWIVEKFHGWSDHDGNIEDVYTKDELLTNITIYWVTNTATSSARLYYESRHPGGRVLPSFFEGFLPTLPEGRVDVPTGCGSFSARYDRRGRRGGTPRSSAAQRYNVVHWAEMTRGGHFPAFEQPDLWINDIRSFYRELR